MDTKALRQKILDLAIRGKLVPQDPNDEPASVLLERIRAEKQQMVKDGKLKAKDIKNDTIIYKGDDNLHYEKIGKNERCIEEEIPFTLPNGWSWTKINTIAFVTKLAGFEYTNNIAPNLCESGVPLFKGKNVQDSNIIYEFESYIPEQVSDELSRSQITRKCILTPYVGTIGNIGIHSKVGKYHLGSNVGKVELYNANETLLEEYVVAYLKSSYGYSELTKHLKATAQASISIEAIRDVYIPVPPANEQHRIVDKLNELLSFVNTIETDKTTLQDLIKQTKSKILDLAIRGKLVPQDPNDEPASVLLERIRAEKEELIRQGKIKRDKKESVIFKGEDNSYYGIDIPTDWIWATIENISCKISDGSHNPPPNSGNGIPLLSAVNIYDNKVNIRSATRWITDIEWISENERTQLETNDVLLTIVGSIGRTAVIDFTERFALQRSVAVIKPCIVDSKYLMFILESPQISQYLIENSKGTAQKGIYLKQLSEIHIPVPPLPEQTRIVRAIETAFTQLDEIANSIA